MASYVDPDQTAPLYFCSNMSIQIFCIITVEENKLYYLEKLYPTDSSIQQNFHDPNLPVAAKSLFSQTVVLLNPCPAE